MGGTDKVAGAGRAVSTHKFQSSRTPYPPNLKLKAIFICYSAWSQVWALFLDLVWTLHFCLQGSVGVVICTRIDANFW